MLERNKKPMGEQLPEKLVFAFGLGKLTALWIRNLNSCLFLRHVSDRVDSAFLIIIGTAVFGHKSENEEVGYGSPRSNSLEDTFSRRRSAEIDFDGGRRFEKGKFLAGLANSEYPSLEIL